MIKKRNGFTLAEVLITLSVVGVIAALTIPQVAGNVRKAHYGANLGKAVQQIECGCSNLLQETYTESADNSYSNDISTIEDAFEKLMPLIGAENTGESRPESDVGEFTYLYESLFMPAAYAARYPGGSSGSGAASNRPGITPPDSGRTPNNSGNPSATQDDDWSDPSTKENQSSIDTTYGNHEGGDANSDRYGNNSGNSQNGDWKAEDDGADIGIPENRNPNTPNIGGGTAGAGAQDGNSGSNTDNNGNGNDNNGNGNDNNGNGNDNNGNGNDNNGNGNDNNGNGNGNNGNDNDKNGTQEQEPVKTNAVYKFKKGSNLSLVFPEKDATTPADVFTRVLIDVNGAGKPNKFGKDVFEFELTNSCKMRPYGMQTYKTDCSGPSITNGRACAARVVADGFKIKY